MTDENQTLPPQGSESNKQGGETANNKPITMESLLNEQDVTIDLPQAGEIRKGTIASVSPSQVLISIGAKSEGVVSSRDLEQLTDEERDALEVGKEVYVYVINPEDNNGNVVLSLKRAQEQLSWDSAEKFLEDMGDEFYAIIKLTSGEEILSLVSIDENDGDPLLLLQNPITMKVYNTHHGVHIKVKSWIEMSSDDIFIIKPDRIITMTETTDDRLIDIYTNYINDEEDDDMGIYQSSSEKESGLTKPSRKMGYISSVESARKKLEDIFKLDTKES